MNKKHSPFIQFMLFSLPVSFAFLLLITGCKQNEENNANAPAPAYAVPLEDKNSDGSPDSWMEVGVPDYRDDYEVILDTETGHEDETSLLIQTDKSLPEDAFGAVARTLPNINQYKGQRLQLSGYIKTENVTYWAGLWFRVDGVGRGNTLAFDNMENRAPTGTTDWQHFILVLDIPDDVGIRDIYYGFLLAGSGKAWVDNIQFDIVGEDVPVTDMATSMQATTEALETAVTQQTIFNELWQTVNDTYVSNDFNGADWPAIKETYRSQIQDSPPDGTFYELMAEMISELNDDHSYFLNPEEAAEEDALFSSEDAFDGVGMFVNITPEVNGLVIAFTFPNSGAEQAGLQPHDIILAADGQPTCCDDAGSTLPYEIRGPAGTTVVLTVQTPGQQPREIEVVRGPISGNAPVMSDVIDGRIGYISIPILEDLTIDEQVETAWQNLNTNGSLEGLILDMRINSGGQREVLQPLLELFTNGAVGEFSSRENTWTFNIAGRDVANSQEIPLIILIGPQTNSYAELFSGILQANGRATVIGQTSRGNVETTYPHDFADGSRAHIATETFIPAQAPDANWEETGIIPDIEIIQAWYDFATPEEDLALTAAIEQFN